MDDVQNGLKEWVSSLESKLDRSIEIGIETRTKVDGLQRQYDEVQATQKAHEMRLSAIENTQSAQRGAFRAACIIGGIMVGLLAVLEVTVLILK